MNRRKKYKPIYDEWIKLYPLTLENLRGEIWKPIPDYEKYHCSNFGRVKSFKKGKVKILKPALTRDGYLDVALSKNGKQKRFRVSRLVAICFIENPECKPEVDHINGVHFNNHVSNLRWATGLENTRYAVEMGLKPTGKDVYNAKLTSAQAEQIRLNPDNLTGKELAKIYGVRENIISMIQLGKSYKNVGGQIRGKKQHPARIPDEIRAEIRAKRAAGVKVKDLIKQYGVCRTSIRNIINE